MKMKFVASDVIETCKLVDGVFTFDELTYHIDGFLPAKGIYCFQGWDLYMWDSRPRMSGILLKRSGDKLEVGRFYTVGQRREKSKFG